MSKLDQKISLFDKLRSSVLKVFRAKHSSSPSNFKDWSGQDITLFQEDLQEKVQTSISEKWFYTYFKQETINKLPRIDMLNLLSQYVGEENWVTFLANNKTIQTAEKKGSKKWLALIFAICAIGALAFMFYPKTIEYQFCFVDEDINLPITTPLQIKIIKKEESPVYLQTSENGCFTYRTKDKIVSFQVESPYYKETTITRKYFGEMDAEEVKLSADEYALILHYFSSNNVDDWKTRRAELSKMIHAEAVIYQVLGNDAFGIDILSKEAFINKITLPTSSLRNMKILEIDREGEQIVKLKFETILDYE